MSTHSCKIEGGYHLTHRPLDFRPGANLLVGYPVGAAEGRHVDAAGGSLPQVGEVVLGDGAGYGEEAEDAAAAVVHQNHRQGVAALA
eukprot:scaffold403721_cov29-Prasinocladus_malaysianus.AAC.1